VTTWGDTSAVNPPSPCRYPDLSHHGWQADPLEVQDHPFAPGTRSRSTGPPRSRRRRKPGARLAPFPGLSPTDDAALYEVGALPRAPPRVISNAPNRATTSTPTAMNHRTPERRRAIALRLPYPSRGPGTHCGPPSTGVRDSAVGGASSARLSWAAWPTAFPCHAENQRGGVPADLQSLACRATCVERSLVLQTAENSAHPPVCDMAGPVNAMTATAAHPHQQEPVITR